MTLEKQLYQEAMKNGSGDSLIPKILPLIEQYASQCEIEGRIDELVEVYHDDSCDLRTNISQIKANGKNKRDMYIDERLAELKKQKKEGL